MSKFCMNKHSESKKSRNTTIDILKFVCIALVVVIHCPTFIHRETIVAVCRIAVPLFFMLSGYLLTVSKKDDETQAKRNIKSAFKYMLFANAVLLIYAFVVGFLEHKSFMGIVSKTFPRKLLNVLLFNQSVNSKIGIIWFINSLFTVSIFHYVFVRFKKVKLYPILASVLLVLCLCFGTYSKTLGLPAAHTLTAVFTGFPFFALGYWLGKKNLSIKSWCRYMLLITGVLLTLLQIVEFNLITKGGGDLYITTIIASICLLLFAITSNFSANTSWLDPRLVFNIYLFHAIVGVEFMRIFGEVKYTAICTILITFALCQGFYMLKTFVVRHKLRKSSGAVSIPN